MESNSPPEQTEDVGYSPQSYTSLRFAPVEQPVTPPASVTKDKDSAPDDTSTEETGRSIPSEAAESPVNSPRVSAPANSSTSQPGPRLRKPLPNSPTRQRGSRPRKPLPNSPIRKPGVSVNQGNDSSTKEPENPPVGSRTLRSPARPMILSANPTNDHSNRQTIPPIVKKPALFTGFPINPITPPMSQHPDIIPRNFLFYTIDVPTPPTRPGGPEGTLQLLTRTSPYEPDFVPDWRANAFWKDNVERVLGREFRDKWPTMMALIREAKASFLEKGDPLINRRWNLKEIEIAARLKGWCMPDFVVAYLIGQPPSDLVMGNEEQFGLWGFDEMKKMDEVDGMGGFGNNEEEREVAAESNDKVHKEEEKKKGKKKGKEKGKGEEEEEGIEVEESDADDLQVYTRSMNR